MTADWWFKAINTVEIKMDCSGKILKEITCVKRKR